ncbi:MAG: DUF4395 family protein [Acidobacteria bacterium]|nr:DUF4395 family protein [Acidobacteriota bacterium]
MLPRVSGVFSFPNPVNEVSARLVAAGVLVIALVTIIFDIPWLTLVLAYGFIARVAAGPKFSPLGLLVTKVITPALPVQEKLVPGPPKRFAQAIGVVFSVSAAILAVGFGLTTAAYVVLGVLAVFAFLESVFGFCAGCRVFAVLMRFGVIPEEVCERCNNLNLPGEPKSSPA